MSLNYKVVALTLVGVAAASTLFAWMRHGASKPKASPVTTSGPVGYDHAASLIAAMKHMGLEPKAMVGDHWLGKGCREISYVLNAGGPRLFLFTRDIESGQITHTVTRDQVNEELRRHVSFAGSFGDSTLAFDGLGLMNYIGRVPDDGHADVYIRLNREACGVQLDRVLYRGLDHTDVVNLKIELLPGR